MPPRFEHEHDDEHEDDLVAATPRCTSVVNPSPAAASTSRAPIGKTCLIPSLESFFRGCIRK
jgi:hypothetical protein